MADEESRVQVNVRMNQELADRIDRRIVELEKERGGGARITRSEVIRTAVIAYLERSAGKKR